MIEKTRHQATDAMLAEWELPPTNLPEEDDTPIETGWHRMQMDLLIESLLYYWRERNDFFVGGATCSSTTARNKPRA